LTFAILVIAKKALTLALAGMRGADKEDKAA
jgi:hypothetical protein